MIYVTDNGVPLAAIVSVEIREPLRGTFHEPKLDPRYYAVGAHCMPTPYLRLPMTEAEAKRLRDEWAKKWPEVAGFLSNR